MRNCPVAASTEPDTGAAGWVDGVCAVEEADAPPPLAGVVGMARADTVTGTGAPVKPASTFPVIEPGRPVMTTSMPFVWSTLPDVEAISGGKLHVPHFTGKAKVDRIVKDAGFAHHTFVIAPFFYQNLIGLMAPQKQEDGTLGWALPVDPTVRGIHMGDITEIGSIVAGAFARPDQAGNGEYLPLVGDFMSFNEIVDTLNRQGHEFSFKRVPGEVFATFFPGAPEIAATFAWFEAHTYLGADSRERIALANRIAGRQPTGFATWARVNLPVHASA
jgi:hypothetical protein